MLFVYSSNEINGWMGGLLGSSNYKRGKYFLHVAMFFVLSEIVVTSMCVCVRVCVIF